MIIDDNKYTNAKSEMKSEHLEVIAKRGQDIDVVCDTVKELRKYHPPYINHPYSVIDKFVEYNPEGFMGKAKWAMQLNWRKIWRDEELKIDPMREFQHVPKIKIHNDDENDYDYYGQINAQTNQPAGLAIFKILDPALQKDSALPDLKHDNEDTYIYKGYFDETGNLSSIF